jgi:hypothetical protein
MRTRKIFWVLSVILFALLILDNAALAQTPLPSYKPGDKLKITVTFAGPDAGKIINVGISLGLTTPRVSGQESLSGGVGCTGTRVEGNKFEATCEIRDNTAAGEYSLEQITAGLHDPDGSFTYAKNELPARTFKVENPRKLTKPELKDVTVVPKQ